ncbi:MAG: transcriptional repressor [Lachnospiraceae bacterium]|nr:transcriptional repressor [Lachnospiraceae bacterium]
MPGREYILERLKKEGLRITSQRKLIIDIILKNECSCCKEIYYEAMKSDPSIGIATVYRMVKTLEEIGTIDRRNMYRVAYGKNCDKEDACMVTLKDEKKTIRLTGAEWAEVVECGLKSMGYLQNQKIDTIMLCSFECGNESCCSL